MDVGECGAVSERMSMKYILSLYLSKCYELIKHKMVLKQYRVPKYVYCSTELINNNNEQINQVKYQ